jgi:hypothetical protein
MTFASLDNYFTNQPAIVDKRLKLDTFAISVKVAPWPFPEQFKAQFAELFYKNMFQAIVEAKLPVGRLRFVQPQDAFAIGELYRRIGTQQPNAVVPWFSIAYQEPGRDFVVSVSDEMFQIRSDGNLLGDIVYLSERIFTRITKLLLSDQLAQATLIHERTSSVSFNFENRLRLGTDKIQDKVVPNYKIMTAALSLDRPTMNSDEKRIEDALRSVGVESYVRIDYMQHALKSLRENTYKTVISLEAPANESNGIIFVNTGLVMEEDYGLNLDAGLSLEVALLDFYRDIVLKRFLDNLLCTTNYSYF